MKLHPDADSFMELLAELLEHPAKCEHGTLTEASVSFRRLAETL